MKTLYYSEQLDKYFDTAEECVSAEQEFKEKQEASQKIEQKIKYAEEAVFLAKKHHEKVCEEAKDRYDKGVIALKTEYDLAIKTSEEDVRAATKVLQDAKKEKNDTVDIDILYKEFIENLKTADSIWDLFNF